MDKLKEMGKFLEMYNLPRANQEKIDNMKKLIPRNKIESLIKKNLPENKSPGPDGFIVEFYQTFRKVLIPILLKLLNIYIYIYSRGRNTSKLIL